MAIAEAYLASFRPVQKVEGFRDILSRGGMNTLGAIPGINAKLGAELAAAALRERGASERLQRNLDAIAAENELTRRNARRLAGTKLGAALMQGALPGSGAAAGVEVGDPLALIERLTAFHDGQAGSRARQTLRSNTYAGEYLRQLG